jgi:hypothetical protein
MCECLSVQNMYLILSIGFRGASVPATIYVYRDQHHCHAEQEGTRSITSESAENSMAEGLAKPHMEWDIFMGR